MQITAPSVLDRLPDQIIEENVYFDSVGYVYRALSWLDVAQKRRNMCALQYGAHDLRQAIEQLLFEELVVSVGTDLDRNEYERCKGNSTKLHKIIKRLSPNYDKLAQFAQAVASVDRELPALVIWNHQVLMKHWGMASKYLHWAGEPSETLKSDAWFDEGIRVVKEAANHIWEKKTSGYTGIMMPCDMQPEISLLWERFKADKIDLEGVRRAADLALPILRSRRKV